MRGVLTQTRKLRGAALLSLLAAFPWVALAAEPTPQPVVLDVPLSSSEIGSVREEDSLMTWKIQKFLYNDGTILATVAGIQFEEALGLSVVVIDPPPAEVAEKLPSTTLDITGGAEKKLPGESPRAEIQIRNLLVELSDLARPESETRAALPTCERGGRRAVVFVRPAQTARTFGIDTPRATELSKYGRAACLRWNGIPEKR
ncbi:MAG: hypothetical protein FJY29_03970 [Betaproteobacteria bacterium]|nr:hypothetical protein [Betaproteobacteria bacterium]